MSDYSELIKRFDKIRDYMRDFHLYGFKSREDFSTKSLRTYDNEKRRIESYLGDLMTFRQDENGKNIFMAIDSVSIAQNPLYRAFKAKSFTKNDISLHFILLDILSQYSELTATQIADIISSEYLYFFENAQVLDLSTVRNKLKEYEAIGIVVGKKQGKSQLYALEKTGIDLNSLYNALVYFSEISPLGVVGSYLLDLTDRENRHITFKHHYIMHVLDSEIAFDILEAINQQRNIFIEIYNPCLRKNYIAMVTPVKMLISVSSGRRYICGYDYTQECFANFRIDYIKTVKILEVCKDFKQKAGKAEDILKYTWGVSIGEGKELERVEILFKITKNEKHIIARINREGRGGTLTQVDEDTYKYEIEVFDSREMITWVRSFIGRIKSFRCSNKNTQKVFYDDLNKMYSLYGGKTDVV